MITHHLLQTCSPGPTAQTEPAKEGIVLSYRVLSPHGHCLVVNVEQQDKALLIAFPSKRTILGLFQCNSFKHYSERVKHSSNKLIRRNTSHSIDDSSLLWQQESNAHLTERIKSSFAPQKQSDKA